MLKSGKIHQGDCIKLMKKIDDESIDLVFADPPFNIGYEYDEYDDRQNDEKYLEWCSEWMAHVHRILSPSGTFWLAIGDEYAAELKVAAQRTLGFTTRSWVIWYYTFGVNCTKKFSRSHAHLFHFVKDPKKFTFNAEDPAIRVLSARALVYGDKRANPNGRLPDDTWILRPQDFQSDAYGFTPEQDTWFFSRVAGTFKERQGFHGCQMPEQLLGRVIRASSNEGDKVFDPFTGSGTTLAVAKKLDRVFLGTELSADYQKYATERLKTIQAGDTLDGPADQIASAPSTANGTRLTAKGRKRTSEHATTQYDARIIRNGASIPKLQSSNKKVGSKTEIGVAGIIDAFKSTHNGFSIDRLISDPQLDHAFLDKCGRLGLAGTEFKWNTLLMGLRKSKHSLPPTTRKTRVSRSELDKYCFASEIALQRLKGQYPKSSLDTILCDPEKAGEFDLIAKTAGPGFTSPEYRWAALTIRKRTSNCIESSKNLPENLANLRLPRQKDINSIDLSALRKNVGLYVLQTDEEERLYVGGTLDLANRIESHRKARKIFGCVTSIGIVKLSPNLTTGIQDGLHSRFISKAKPLLNLKELAA